MSSSPSHADRIDALDSARGLAAIAVVWSHLVGAFGMPPGWPDRLRETPMAVLWDGSAAVSMFFVLSGLVLSRKFFAPPPAAGRMADDALAPYFVARVCRIVPPYVGAVIFSALLAGILPPRLDIYPVPSAWLQSLWQIAGGAQDLIRQCLFLVSKDQERYLPQAWTLTIELKFSLLLPFLVVIARRSAWWLVIFTVLTMGILSGAQYLLHFTIGILISLWALPARSRLRGFHPIWKFALLLAGVVFYAANYTIVPWVPTSVGTRISWALTGFGSALLLVVLLAWRRLESLLNHAWLRFAGRVSYSVYLLHFAVLICVTPRVLAAMEAVGWHGEWTSRIVAAITTLALTLAISALFYRWVEIPSIAFGRWLGKLTRRWTTPSGPD